MVYITSTGQMQATRSRFSPSYLVELFWAFINLIGLFFSTILGDPKQKVGNAPARATGSSSSGSGNHPGPRGMQRRNIRGMSDLNRPGPKSCPGGGCGM